MSSEPEQSRNLPAQARLWILSDGRAGHEAQTLGLAQALGLLPDLRRISPRWLFSALAPFGPADPRDRGVIAPPYPDIALAAGRRTIPYLRRLKRASRGRVFTVYVNRPATGAKTADVIVAPRHDGFFAANVIAPLTPANDVTPALLARLRQDPDPRLTALPSPRTALLIGGDSRHFRYTPQDAAALVELAKALLAQGGGVMATASRRTPAPIRAALQEALADGPVFLWDGTGDNPYRSMLALADHIVVTADSVNMVGEAVATGAPVQVFAPTGGARKIRTYLEALEEAGAVRPWRGEVETWRYAPINSTPMIAEHIWLAYARFRRTLAQ